MPTSEILLLALLAISLVIDVAGVAVGLRLWRARGARAPIRAVTSVYLAVTIVVMVLALVGVLHGFRRAMGAMDGESVDPSKKARVLAEGISEVLNVTAFAVLVTTPLAMAVLVYAWIRRDRGTNPQRR